MKERPILFSGAMVRAILEGRKTVTRRISKNQLSNGWDIHPHGYGRITSAHPLKGRFGVFIQRGAGTDFPETDLIPSPYGMPGDRIWVRESYADIGCRLTYRADLEDGAHCQVNRWTPGIHMFRRDSRMLLDVTAVRFERLQGISEDQALAEGVTPSGAGTPEGMEARFAFRDLWFDINGAESWEANPWVWVVEFRRVAA